MHLIFGGAYQGKRDFVKEKYGITEDEIYDCIYKNEKGRTQGEAYIDFTKAAIYGLEYFIRCCVVEGIEAKDYLESHKDKWQDKVFICTDLSNGVVPYEKELRQWREMVGRTMVYLGKEAGEVTRLFCGIPHKVK